MPLYGSGGRTSRISAAIWPTCCLSMPLTMISVCAGTSNVMPGGGVDHDGVRVADAQLERRPAQRGAVADALDLEALLEALRDALDHVRHERARQAVQRAVLAALGRALDEEHPVVLLDRIRRGTLCVSSPERAVRP